MKTLVNLIALCFVVTMIGCQTTQTADVSPGAISECGAKQGQVCTKDKSECCHSEKCERDKADCEGKKADCHHKGEVSPGAMSECGAKKGCERKADCEGKAEVSPGAMSECGAEKKQRCGAAKAGCSR